MPYINKEDRLKNSREYREKNKEKLKLNARRYREKNKEKIKERLKIYGLNNPEKVMKAKRKNSLKKRYNITLDDYDKMFEKQKGKCGICKTPQIEIKKIFCVDHNHKTEKVRELLCQKCNVTLSYFENYDSKPYIEYLKKHKEKLN
jgi:hypothetical protein